MNYRGLEIRMLLTLCGPLLARIISMIFVAGAALSLTGCLQSGGGGSSNATPAAAIVAPVDEIPVEPEPVDVMLKVYSVTRTRPITHAHTNYPSVTVSAACTVVDSEIYCWDDGPQSLIINNMTQSTTYFGIGNDAINGTTYNEGWTNCYNFCNGSWMSTPRLIVPNTQLANMIQAQTTVSFAPSVAHITGVPPVAEILATGTETEVQCVQTGATIVCDGFTIVNAE